MSNEQVAKEPSEEDALAALQAIGREMAARQDAESKPEPVATKAEVAEQVGDESTPGASSPAETQAETVVGQVDDVESLKARLKQSEDLYESLRSKASASLDWSRNLGLRTATERDNLKQALKKIREKGEVSAEEIDRLLAGNQPNIPQTTGGYQPQADDYSQTDAFKWQLDAKKSDEYCANLDAWIRQQAASGSIQPYEVIPGNAYATLHVLNARYESEMANSQPAASPSPAVIKAARNVARTQRAAARAAGPPSNRSAASPPADLGEDLSALIRKDPDKARESGLVDRLFKELHASIGL